ncbi:MAG: sigma 54-interacting transcriptional regulator [Deltaproteobacteria bacterium]|nr:sigma 54-interacting transcriptional regulator [Deltaproteobacteria bacterium]
MNKIVNQYSELFHIGQIITSEIDYDILFDVIIKQTNKVMGVERCSIFLLDEKGEMLNAFASAGVGGLAIQVPKSRGIAGWVFNNREPAVVNNVYEDTRFYPEIDKKSGLRTNNVLCVPLINRKNECIGALEIVNKNSGEFTNDDREVLMHLSNYVAIALENARLFAELEEQTNSLIKTNLKLEQEIDHRQKAEAQLDKYRQQLEEKVEKQNAELQQSQKAMADLKRDLKMTHRFRNMIGKSDSMQDIYALIKELADVSATVLVTGESGSGKELVVEALHTSGQRQDRPFVKVNCSALSESVLESELFGHVKGAFTGADKDTIGRFQKAANGTILLDEIGDVSQHFQKRLLRVLQEHEFERLGDTTTLRMNARVIAATNQDLLEKVRRKEFREDLYYRLKVVEIKVPPLRERKEDIPLLIKHFLGVFNKELDKKIKEVSAEVLKILMDYHWPGNVRELRNTLEHISILCKGEKITENDLPADFAGRRLSNRKPFEASSYKKESILQALEKAKWNKTRAAQLLKISRRTLYRKLNEYKIE